jgi:hypothetical protein
VILMQPARRPFNLTRVPSLYPTLHMSAQQSSIPALADALSARVQSTWSSGDFGRIARSYERGAAEFIARLELEPMPTRNVPSITVMFSAVGCVCGAIL